MVCTSCLSNGRKLNRRIVVPGGLGKKRNPISKITEEKGLEVWGKLLCTCFLSTKP
jgi:hypothetical protein